ncbi:cuticle protein 18.6-like [Penaeus chinensis]|uniref:cuticle protein 18.6-like n=1 Tax=Penaeus chinensis TaxID=139456 RepID=UPI001FB73DBF|nr:cuticle protein 18.6-like [Penaeus chinensis]
MSSKAVIIAALIMGALADSVPRYSPPTPSYSPTTPAYNPPTPAYNPPAPAYNPPAPAYNAPAPSGPAQYDFNYAVKDDYSGNDFGHQEARDGYDTQGTFYVQLPDGRLQTVTYNVNGDSGFLADVAYQGEAQYPAQEPSRSYQPAPSPSYQPAPTPVYG